MCNRHAFHQNCKSHYGKHSQQYSDRKREKWAKFQAFRQGFSQVPVNVQELDDRFELYVYAAGYNKTDFKLSLVDMILKISADKKETETAENAKWRKQEFHQNGFVRQFELNDNINTETISAKYNDGVLVVTLPKLEGKETTRQEIKIE